VLFDDPTASLHPELVNEVLQTMESLAGEGITMMIVTHEMAFARHVADRVIFLDQGQVMEVSRPSVWRGRRRVVVSSGIYRVLLFEEKYPISAVLIPRFVPR
jgi:ABC-type polar amino acid transport system ATPase subunit